MRVVLLFILLQLPNLGNLIHAFPSSTFIPNSMTRVQHTSSLSMVVQSPFDKIERDFQALTRRVTAYHILLPKSTEAALSLKQKIRNRVNPPKSRDSPPTYVIDAFNQAARRYSLDDETKLNGGLLGELLPQGACRRVPELDKACFEVPLGHVAGPIETDYGFHLLIVEERTNCAQIDGLHSKIVRGGTDGAKTVYVGPSGNEEGSNFATLAAQQFSLWIGIFIAGSIVAELAAKAAEAIDI